MALQLTLLWMTILPLLNGADDRADKNGTALFYDDARANLRPLQFRPLRGLRARQPQPPDQHRLPQRLAPALPNA